LKFIDLRIAIKKFGIEVQNLTDRKSPEYKFYMSLENSQKRIPLLSLIICATLFCKGDNAAKLGILFDSLRC
jgi:hypothetical protein